ncbi:hypothetical protein [Denitratisoma oestradiolicum]|uniref:Secretion system X translation initiation factor n=1 Tax=Denitratisoma oestradiolicum TaxID=311182 RepID=A0A6S6XZB6_9PROT|nr:hypothetical protein [Denitratisoma oestradiolicum]CAB1369757.1 conserved protein of unknown function [Denitratisoma oestradiolicum]
MTPRQRWILWGSLLVALVGTHWIDGGSTSAQSAVVEALPAHSGRSSLHAVVRSNEDSDILALASRQAAAQSVDLFAPKDWTPPLPPPAPAGAPSAPPLPFMFLGKKLEAEQWQVFLGRDERTYVAVEGDTMDELYRIESIRPPILTLRYLPLQQLQTLSIGDPN